MPIDRPGGAIRFGDRAEDRVPVPRALGCPRCGSTCARLDGCPVCAGEAPCARCVFGPRVDDDEIHAALALEG